MLTQMKLHGLDSKESNKFLDIGSGLGNLLYQVALNTKKAQVEGLEIDSARS